MRDTFWSSCRIPDNNQRLITGGKREEWDETDEDRDYDNDHDETAAGHAMK